MLIGGPQLLRAFRVAEKWLGSHNNRLHRQRFALR